MHTNNVPFLWNYVKNEEKSLVATGGEERRPLTASANEEASHAIIEIE